LTRLLFSANYTGAMSTSSQVRREKKVNAFFARHAVFTVEELGRFLASRGSANVNTRKSLLTYHKNRGRVVPVRRGLYATVPEGADPATFPVDPFLVAAKLADDAVLAYHTALEFHGKAHSVHTKLRYVSAKRSLPLRFQSHDYERAPVPNGLLARKAEMTGVVRRKISGVELRVAGLERTLVDVLDRPDLSGSWEEIWRSLESVEFFDLDSVAEYVRLLDNATTAAKVGFFLERHKETLMVEASHLAPLREMRPKQPHYLERGKRKGGRWIKAWNLIVPDEILNKSWEGDS